jgi:hypothetical protein
MVRKFKELEEKMSSESLARVQAGTARLVQEIALYELHAAREMTQVSLAKILNVNQSEISKIENRIDMYVSTLANFVQAMGGELEICAVFPEGRVRINQFERLGGKEEG